MKRQIIVAIATVVGLLTAVPAHGAVAKPKAVAKPTAVAKPKAAGLAYSHFTPPQDANSFVAYQDPTRITGPLQLGAGQPFIVNMTVGGFSCINNPNFPKPCPAQAAPLTGTAIRGTATYPMSGGCLVQGGSGGHLYCTVIVNGVGKWPVGLLTVAALTAYDFLAVTNCLLINPFGSCVGLPVNVAGIVGSLQAYNGIYEQLY